MLPMVMALVRRAALQSTALLMSLAATTVQHEYTCSVMPQTTKRILPLWGNQSSGTFRYYRQQQQKTPKRQTLPSRVFSILPVQRAQLSPQVKCVWVQITTITSSASFQKSCLFGWAVIGGTRSGLGSTEVSCCPICPCSDHSLCGAIFGPWFRLHCQNAEGERKTEREREGRGREREVKSWRKRGRERDEVREKESRG